MKIFYLSKYGDGIALSQTFTDEGHEVIACINEPFFQSIYDGCVKKVNDLKRIYSMITKKDMLVCDCIGFGEFGDSVRAKGVPVYGAQKIADKLEDDRFFGLQIMAKYGVKVPLTTLFSSHAEGVKYVKANPERYVYKPFGAGSASAKTYVASDADDMIAYLQSQKKDGKYILQAFIDGLEYSTEMFFSRGKPVEPSFHTIEDKKAYAGELGPATGCMDTVQIADSDLNNKAIKEGLGKLFDYMEEIEYTGNIDLNSVIDKNGDLWGIEFTCRDGWSSSYARNYMLDEPVSMLYDYITRGEASKVELKKGLFGLSVRFAIPPYPEEEKPESAEAFRKVIRQTAGRAVIVKSVHEDIQYNFLDVKIEKGKLVTAGCDGIIAEITTGDKDIIKGRERIFKAIEDIKVNDLWYRVDAFDRALEQLPKVKKSGYYDGPDFKES